jgi:hypothetical protein
MNREQRIVQVFVHLTDTMVDDFDVVEFQHRLVNDCVELLDCAEAGLLLVDAAGGLRVMASSSERANALELLQTQNREGPCFECYRTGQPVFSENLAEDSERWSTFAPTALRMGFASAQAFPMRVRGETVGALNLFRATPGRISPGDMTLGQGIADIATVALLQERALRESRSVVEQLQTALTSRVIIEQAKGVLAEQAQISVDAAFARLRAHARQHNLRLSEVARELIDGRLAAESIADVSARLGQPGG